MKYLPITFTVFLWITFTSFAQNPEKDLSSQKTSSTSFQDTSPDQANNFIKLYELEDIKKIKAKLMDDGMMRTSPEADAPLLNVTAPKGEVVYIYRYFSEQRCWAVNYNDNWGFIDDILIFPMREESETETTATFDEPPKLKSKLSPDYPKEAKEAGIVGKVYIKVFIDKDGKVKETIILKGIDELNQAAIDALVKAKFAPAKYKGDPVGIWLNLSITFE
jgi:protein TonB